MKAILKEKRIYLASTLVVVNGGAQNRSGRTTLFAIRQRVSYYTLANYNYNYNYNLLNIIFVLKIKYWRHMSHRPACCYKTLRCW